MKLPRLKLAVERNNYAWNYLVKQNMNNLLQNLSIIVPIAPREEAWVNLWADLKDLSAEIEIIFTGPEKPHSTLPSRIKWITAPLGRAKQLNCGARAATKDHLWFVHADSRFAGDALMALAKALRRPSNAVHYFDLRFLNDGPTFMFINEIGCWIRSRLLGVPFGDQGFCLSRMHFERIGGFPEDVAYGEDHVFVWRAKQNGIALNPLKAILKTSARRYRDQSWLKTTMLLYKLWTKQAQPEKKRLKTIQNGLTTAVAVFVKTPERSPLKTRLAASIGNGVAIAFYELCLKAVRTTLSNAGQATESQIIPYWAVAERQGLGEERWQHFSQVWQGQGELGKKLHTVYSSLFSVHGRVMLIGADTPQLPQNLILETHHILKDKNKFVVGPARDGGFYLFGGSASLPKEVWTSVTYSQSKTCEELVSRIKDYGEIILLPQLTDVDVFDDLKILKHELQNNTHPTQIDILNWIETIEERETLWA